MLKGDTLPQARELHHEMDLWALGGHIILVPTTIFIPTSILTNTETLQEHFLWSKRWLCLITRDLDPFFFFFLKLYAKLTLHNIKQLHMIT